MFKGTFSADKNKAIPGFGLSFGITFAMVGFVVLVPLASIPLMFDGYSFKDFWETIADKQAVYAYVVSFSCAAFASGVNLFFGIVLAWILVRYNFPFKRLLDGMIELPFALPTSVAGISLTALYSDKGLIGGLFNMAGIKISYTPAGIVVSMIFVGIPFVVRSIQPVLEKLDRHYEEAAQIMGADSTHIFFKVIFPEIFPAAISGFGMAFARSLGEYGSVVFISGNIPYKTQTLSLVVMNKLEQFNYPGAASIALVMFAAASFVLFLSHILQTKRK